MLSEEEKKAVELLEDIKNNSWTTKYIMSSDSKNADILLNLITKLQKENEEKRQRINDLEFALLDMVMQFANRVKTKGCSYALDTMGLSSLELAFNELGFNEMYSVNKAEEKYKILEKQYFE